MRSLALLAAFLATANAWAIRPPHDSTDICFDFERNKVSCADPSSELWMRIADIEDAAQNAGPPVIVKDPGEEPAHDPSPVMPGFVLGANGLTNPGIHSEADGYVSLRMNIKNFYVQGTLASEGRVDSKRVGAGYFVAIPMFTKYGTLKLKNGKEIANGEIRSQKGVRLLADYIMGRRFDALEGGKDTALQVGAGFTYKAGQGTLTFGLAHERILSGLPDTYLDASHVLNPVPESWRSGLRIFAEIEFQGGNVWFPKVKKGSP